MIALGTLPRDVHGHIAGAWRLLHSDPSFRGTVGAFDFVSGCSTRPAHGRQLAYVAAECGSDIYLEPWPDLRPGEVPEWITVDLPAEVLAQLDPCPWRAAGPGESAAASAEDTPDAPQDDLEALDLDGLRNLSDTLGLVAGNKQEKALRKMIRAARLT